MLFVCCWDSSQHVEAGCARKLKTPDQTEDAPNTGEKAALENSGNSLVIFFFTRECQTLPHEAAFLIS